MSETLKIEVTPDDIVTGWSRCKDRCPVALAVLRALPTHQIFRTRAWFVAVGQDDVYLHSGGGGIAWAGALPWKAVQFVDEFDSEDDGLPFSFDLELERDFS